MLHQAASHRTDGHHEGEDAHVDRAAASLHGQLRVLSHAEDDVRRDLALAEAVNRALPGAEVCLDARPGLGWCDVGEDGGSNDSTWMPTESIPRSATSSMTSSFLGGSN